MRERGKTLVGATSRSASLAKLGGTQEAILVGAAEKSLKQKMVIARKAAIRNGSYVLPALTAAEAEHLIKSSPLLAYLSPKPKKSTAKN